MPTDSQRPFITANDLESHLWDATNILRGSPVDRTDWKSYILPLLFYKRICDVWDEEHERAVETYGEDFADEHRFQVPEGCHWDDVRGTPKNVGAALQDALRCVETANQKHLYGVFGDAQWSNKERLPDELVKNLLEPLEVVISATGGDERYKPFERTRDQEEALLDRFRDEADPLKVLIVTAKLLTGFDAPVLQAMYLDKPLRDHTLLQAITRTNRTYGEAKGFGLIVDYTQDVSRIILPVLRQIGR